MSQKARILEETGAISILVNKNVIIGSTSAVTPEYVPTATTFADANATVTVAQLGTGSFVMTPTVAGRTLTLPTAASVAGYLQQVGESMNFSVVNLGATGDTVVIAAGTGGTLVGNNTVGPAATASGSGIFTVVMTNVTSGSQAYTVTRIA